MQADFSVECGADNECLEIPWSSGDGLVRYADLRRQPELIDSIEEARNFPELREFLKMVNAPTSALQSAKCDAWFTTELNAEEEIFGAPAKFGSYVDVIFADAASRSALSTHEHLARDLVRLLARAPEMPAAAEFLIRRAWFHYPSAGRQPIEGFYLTCYVFGYGSDEEQSRKLWDIALKLFANAMVQISAKLRAAETGQHQL